MRKIIFLFIALFSISACKKGDDNTISTTEVKPLSNKIILNPLEVVGTASVKLTWSKPDMDNFDRYVVQREVDNGPNSISQTTLKQITDKNQTTYIDTEVPYKANVRYSITGITTNGIGFILSNIVTYVRPTANLLNINPYDVLFDKENGLVYFIESGGTIFIYDIAKNQVTKTLNTAANIGYCDIAVYNGKKELYVPRNDGWVFVYDALTLDKITQISVNTNASTVLSRKDLLYVGAYNYGSLQPLKVVSRLTGLKISESINEDIKRIKHIPNSETDMLIIDPAGNQSIYQFNQDGTFAKIAPHPFSAVGIYPNSKLVEFFPDGSKYIATSKGDILNKDMSYNNIRLTNDNFTFTTFGFSNDQSVIYAGTTKKTIESYNVLGFTGLKSYTTSGVPFKVFDLGTQLLCISNVTEKGPDVTGIAVELLNK